MALNTQATKLPTLLFHVIAKFGHFRDNIINLLKPEIN